jgi:phenylacetate-CoA ligase
MVRFAYENVPYYHDLVDSLAREPADFDGVDKLQKLPTLAKSELARSNSLLRARGARGMGWRMSTGTTGAPVPITWSAEQYRVFLVLHVRQITVAGFRPWNKMVTVWPPVSTWRRVAGPDGSTTPATIIQETPVSGYIRYLAPRFSHLWSNLANPASDAESLARLNPDFIVCTPSRLRRIARVGGDAVARIRPKRIFFSNELVTETTRRFLEETFHARGINCYGASEFGPLGWECPVGRGIHTHSDYLIYEVLKDGERVGPGETGELTLTSLHNTAMPLLRYATGDIVKVAEEGMCGCGSWSMRLEAICGRFQDGLLANDGSRLLPLQVAEVVEASIGPIDYQLVQKRVEQFDLRLHGREMVNPAAIDSLKRGLAEIIGRVPDIEVLRADDHDFMRKNRPVICEIKIADR